MPVVLLHPVGLDGSGWRFLPQPELSGAVRYDLLGHGGRPLPDEHLTLGLFADDLVAGVDGPLDLVGLSMGGQVALHAALRHPGRVRSLLLAATSAGGTGDAARRDKAATVERLGVDAILEETLARWFTAEAIAAGHPGVADARAALRRSGSKVLGASWRALAGNDVWGELGGITAPTTLVRPEADGSAAATILEEMAARIPGSRLRRVPGPHLAHLEEPEAFGAAVLEHLAWVEDALGERVAAGR